MARGQREQRSRRQACATVHQIAGGKRNDQHCDAADRRSRHADRCDIWVNQRPEMLDGIEKRWMVIDLVEQDVSQWPA
jgi:hypothetical protein